MRISSPAGSRDFCDSASSRTPAVFSRRRDLAWIASDYFRTQGLFMTNERCAVVLRARSLVPLVKARDFGMTPSWRIDVAVGVVSVE
jgi:hypothetical protein